MILRSGDDPSKKTPETSGTGAGASTRAGANPGSERDMGAALRKVYQHAVDESIPAEMLDLLGRLD